MMIRFNVLSYNGLPPTSPLAATFGDEGGTVGRADTNTLVLPDPDRTVSRTHAQIRREGTQFFMLDRGSNAVLLNGRPLDPGRAVPIDAGDRVQIGGYLLAVDGVEGVTSAPSPAQPPDLLDPFADLLGTAASTGPPDIRQPEPGHPLAPPPAPQAADPFADWPQAATGRARRDEGLAGLVPEPGLPRSTSGDLDDLFELGGSRQGADPLGGTPLAAPLAEPNTAASLDPLAGLSGGGHRVPPAPVPDQVPEWAGAYQFPAARAPAAQEQDPFAELEAAFAPPAPQAPPRVAPPATDTAPDTAADTASSVPALARALAEGLGVEGELPPLTPEFMRLLGVLLREATEGTRRLLVARAATKRELRATLTIIEPRENNPLKLSPTVEAALFHLLRRPQRGFLDAPSAMRGAYADLVAHQLGMTVGVQAALNGVLAKFAPDQLERRIGSDSVLASLVPAHRRARLWEQFVALYGRISQEAEDDFHTLFGKAFLQAYEEQVARLRRDEG